LNNRRKPMPPNEKLSSEQTFEAARKKTGACGNAPVSGSQAALPPDEWSIN
jgi:hypothetical protein